MIKKNKKKQNKTTNANNAKILIRNNYFKFKYYIFL